MNRLQSILLLFFCLLPIILYFCSMRVVIQRVSEASVGIDGNEYSRIGKGLLVLVGCEEADGEEDIKWLASKIVNLRIFDDEQGVMNRSLMDVGGEILVVSQFTLWASYKKGNRPSYLRAGRHEITVPLYERFCGELTDLVGDNRVKTGRFGADMKVALTNDGPVTICMDTKNKE